MRALCGGQRTHADPTMHQDTFTDTPLDHLTKGSTANNATSL